jgi:transposase
MHLALPITIVIPRPLVRPMAHRSMFWMTSGIMEHTRVQPTASAQGTVGQKASVTFGNLAFAQLRQFISYKAQLAGVRVIVVDPRHTSQRCNACGHTERRNRKRQAEFCCVVCGHTAHADCNAALNISWAAVRQPIVSGADTSVVPETSPSPLGLGI